MTAEAPKPETAPATYSKLGQPLPQSADPIDRVVRLAPTWTVFVLIACGLLVLGTVVWAFRGQVTTAVPAPALYVEGGTADIVSKNAVSVSQVLIELGQQVQKGQRMLSLTDGSSLVAPQAGVVSSILVSNGSAMWPGKIAARITDPSVSDTVVSAVRPELTGTLVPDMPVQIEMSSAPAARFGYLLGTIDEISADPYTTAQMADSLEMDPQVVASSLGSQPALLVVIRLQSANTPSGYAWSIGKGPSFIIAPGVPGTARMILSQKRPIEVVFG